ncbi:hypothetical protein ACFQZX_03975 [Mucilaginibacter litoreus]|uniref:Nucleotide-diphospho-sugar transferase domain-containing protein n=1 Tax=Mucilaginibacter litoreus TaxID=1048221 RepID=A0ABW3AP21_9SPHI
MFKRLHNSFAFRFPVLFYKNWLTFKSSSGLNDKPLASFNYAVLCGKKHFSFLKQELLSVQKRFRKLPFMYVYLDFGFPEKLISDIQLLYPKSKLKIIFAADCIKFHQERGNKQLVEFASKNPMGLKLAAILQTVDLKVPVVYADTDVLWLNDPIDDIEGLLNSSYNIHMQYDYQPGYDFNLIEKAQLLSLYHEPYYCAGLMLINRLNKEQLDTVNNMLPILVEKSGHLSEQTIFAYLQKNIGASGLTPDKYILKYDDQFEIRFRAKKEWIARHYIGPVRHLFWRDAFYN